MRRLVGLALVLVSACGGPRLPPATPSSSTPVSSPAAPLRPERDVVVLLVVDQLAGWIADARLPLLPRDGGFARLVAAGGGSRLLEHGHAVTDTAPGHAALFTGRLPTQHGIGANEVLGEDGNTRSILLDPSTRLVAFDGPTDRPGSSLANLRGDTVADRLKARSPDAHVVAISLKDRTAVIGGGRHPDAVIYFDPSLDRFVTTTSVADTLPEFAVAQVADLDARRREPWTLLDAAFVTANATVPDDAPGEGDLRGFGTVFPHRFEASSRPGYAFRASPRSDVALVDLALASMQGVPDGPAPVLLVVSFSANDYVGHVFGPSSHEAWDTLRRLDGELARLLDGLDGRFGAGRYSVLLSADHGVFEMPEEDITHAPWCPGPDPYERPCTRAYRLDAGRIAIELERAADAALGAGDHVLGVADPYVRFTPAVRALPSARRRRLVERLITTVRGIPGLVDAIDTSDPHACESGRGAPAAILCAAIVPELGDLYLVPAAGAFYDSTYVLGFGSGHGSPMLYDRRVPFLVMTASDAPDLASVVGPPGGVVRYDTYFSVADRLLGGDGVARDP